MLKLVPAKKIAVSREGYEFSSNERTWKISREHPINLRWIDELLENNLKEAFISVLAHYAEKYSSAHTHNQAMRFQHFAKTQFESSGKLLSAITPEALISYRSTLSREHEWYLGSLRGFLKSWLKLGYTGISSGIKSLLDSWRLKGNVKGRAVQTLSPTEGPLSDLEFEALHVKLVEAFETSLITIEDFMLAQIFMTTGRRPSQLADLKIKDLIEAKAESGLHEFILNVPRRKQRNANWREQFKPFALSVENGLLLKDLIEQHRSKIFQLFGISAISKIEELPIFPRWKVIKSAKQKHLSFKEAIENPNAHYVTEKLRVWLLKIVSKLAISSERTGEELRVFPTRLRRTLATRAAREGFGELIIAELLDHTDTQNARIYTENVPEHVDAINKAVAQQLAPLAQAFSGVIVERESDAIRGDNFASRVRSESGNLGTCGHHGFCGALAPIACYTCRNFQPWLDAPHRDVLESLLTEKERILKITNDQTIASVNDRTILAVTQVMQICKKRKEEIKKELRCD